MTPSFLHGSRSCGLGLSSVRRMLPVSAGRGGVICQKMRHGIAFLMGEVAKLEPPQRTPTQQYYLWAGKIPEGHPDLFL